MTTLRTPFGTFPLISTVSEEEKEGVTEAGLVKYLSGFWKSVRVCCVCAGSETFWGAAPQKL